MSSWQKHFHQFVWKTETRVDRWKQQFRDKMGLDGDWHIQMYHGYIHGQSIRLEGRVLQDRGIAVGREDSTVTNLLNSYKRLGSREAAGARLGLEVLGHQIECLGDEEGYFKVDCQPDTDSWPAACEARARLLSHEPYDRDFRGRVFGCASDSKVAVISDVDDTILVTGAISLRQMARWTFLHNAYSRRKVPGVAAWYRAIQQGPTAVGHNPIFYVSSSPWNFFDLIDDFIRLNDIPAGPLLLRDYGIDERKLMIESHGSHKVNRCEELLRQFPDHQFLLIGDAGQEDAYIYRDLARVHPERIQAVLIRSVPGNRNEDLVRNEIELARKEGLPIFFIRDSAEGAAICRDLGIVSEAQVEAVRRAMTETKR